MLSWSGWKEVPGARTTDAAPCAARFDGRTYLFCKGDDDGGRIHFNRTADGAVWDGWQEVRGDGITDTGMAAVANPSPTLILYLFCKGAGDGRIYVNMCRDGETWGGWVPVPDATTGLGPSAGYVVAPLEHNIRLACVGQDQRIYENRLLPDKWEGWKEAPGDGRTNAPVSLGHYGGQIIRVAKGMDNHVYVNDGGSWSIVPGGTTDAAPALLPSQDVGAGAGVCLFVKGIGDRRVYMNVGR